MNYLEISKDLLLVEKEKVEAEYSELKKKALSLWRKCLFLYSPRTVCKSVCAYRRIIKSLGWLMLFAA